jgi:hypothetical protein
VQQVACAMPGEDCNEVPLIREIAVNFSKGKYPDKNLFWGYSECNEKLL